MMEISRNFDLGSFLVLALAGVGCSGSDVTQGSDDPDAAPTILAVDMLVWRMAGTNTLQLVETWDHRNAVALGHGGRAGVAATVHEETSVDDDAGRRGRL